MAYKITDGCIGCGACEGTCPVGAISNDGSVCVIDADTCMECGALRRRMSSRSYQPGIISRYVYCSSNKKEMHFYASLFLFHIFSYLFRCWQRFYCPFCCNR